jgi:uncharacterized protein (DUF983 family)
VTSGPLALALQRCPRCRKGALFGGIIAMNPRCAVCGLDLEPEVGYYTGAMVVSYVLSIPLLTLVAVVVGVITRWDLGPVIVFASLLYLAFVIPLFRYARSIWLYLDWWLNPGSFRAT